MAEEDEAQTEQAISDVFGDEAVGSVVSTEDLAIMGIDVEVVAVLGTAELRISQILQLGRGAVVELEREINEPVELIAEGQLVARGEVVAIDQMLAVQLTEIIRKQS